MFCCSKQILTENAAKTLNHFPTLNFSKQNGASCKRSSSGQIFLLVDLRELFFRFRVGEGGGEKAGMEEKI